MPQCSPAYAVGRVRVMEGSLIGRGQLERLAGLGTVDELCRALGELGWGEVKSKAEIEARCDQHMLEACRLIRDCSSNSDVTDCFLIQYDVLNLKALIKAKALHIAQVALSPFGVMEPEPLRRAVEENTYQDLPPALRAAMQDIEKRATVHMDPLYADSALDKAMFRFIEDKMRQVSDETIKAYFVCRAELVNLMIALRAHAMGRGAAFARDLFVPGGTLGADALARVADEPERAYDAIRFRPYAGALASDVKAQDLSAIERAGDDYLLSLMRPFRYEPTSILPLIGYMLARSRESQAVRLLATAKAAHVSQDRVLARLRALY